MIYKKNKSRKRAFTDREAVDAREVDEARARRRASIEIQRIVEHQQIMNQRKQRDE
jgi:hypothetical protein